jgi:OPA family glycerol-3-phosphate transporter-like MFS transporter/OPA family sugar phosphate sensor protein UhpC-like MFS transporter
MNPASLSAGAPVSMDSSAASAAVPAGTARRFRYWQWRTLAGAMFGYAAFYFVRKNLSIAMPAMEADLHISKADLGLFLTLHGVLYGVSKFFNGPIADRVNARYFMVTGLLLAVVANFVFGLSSSVLVLGITWMCNGWVQGMGFPPVCRLMTHWFPPQKLASRMSIWNTSHSIGAWIAVVASGYIVVFGWRWVFLVPAMCCTAAAGILFLLLRDTPSSVGLPEIAVAGAANDSPAEDRKSAEYKAFVRRQVFGNPYIWWVSFANFFVYVLRFAVLDWGPTLLKEMKGFTLLHAGWMVAGFEAAGLVGMLLAGWLTDRVFGGRGARMCVFCMIGACVAMFLFWKTPASSPVLCTTMLGAAGFFIYGPQALIAIIAANLATRRAAATAAGLTGLFGYVSTVFSGWGVGRLVESYGWNVAFGVLLGVGALGGFMFILAWPAKAHGYDEQT